MKQSSGYPFSSVENEWSEENSKTTDEDEWGVPLGIIRGNYFVMPRAQPVGMSTEDMSTREIMAELKKIIDAKGMSVEEFGKMDADGDGKVDGPELSKAMKEAMEGLTFMQVSPI